ncbi:CopD family protein [Methylocapsa polymorpha]|uniref:CopD family protein n=1 Tax=Methylocapsa polymorpha TaxID=3080828 RepID=A0ABZ0HUX9_9HYPH|nr:CopD family protein [Methylocapsa sp. RX1]
MLDPLAIARAVATIAAAIVLGSGFLIWYAQDARASSGGLEWRRRVVLLIAASGVVGLIATALFATWTASGAAEAGTLAFNAGALQVFLRQTWAGRVMAVEIGYAFAAALLAGVAWLRLEKTSTSDLSLLAAIVAGLGLATFSFASHPTSADPKALAIFAAIAHRIGFGLWLGGLPALILLIGVGPVADDSRRLAALILRQFSQIATIAMAAILVSGVVLTWLILGEFAPLIGTTYGRLLVAKLLCLAGVLAIARSLQLKLLPELEGKPSDATFLSYARRVKVETALAVLIVIFASYLAGRNEHEDIVWPLPFRFSIAATWGGPWVAAYVIGGAALALLGLGLIGLAAFPKLRPASFKPGQTRPAFIAGAVVAVAGAGLALPAISVQAYPDTFLGSDIPYSVEAIASGLDHFEQNCTPCHGVSGLGNGPLAKTLPRIPADFSAPHTALHTGGDLYWWVTHGILPSGMPAFDEILSEDARWEIINFMGAFSVGYQGRVIGPTIAVGQAWMAPPDFSLTDENGVTGLDVDYRGKSALLLVFSPGGAEDEARLEQLLSARQRLSDLGAKIVLIAPPKTGDALRERAAGKILTVNQNQDYAFAAYGLLTRTFADAKVDAARVPIEHVEFLIDRSGYIRGRWIPSQESGAGGWGDLSLLEEQLQLLAKEPLRAPPPDVHAH